MPTTTNSTSFAANRRRISANRARLIQLPDLERGLHERLNSPQALLGSEPQHLADLSAIYAILVDVGSARLWACIRGRLRHTSSLQRLDE